MTSCRHRLSLLVTGVTLIALAISLQSHCNLTAISLLVAGVPLIASGDPRAVSLSAATTLIKLVPLELIEPEPEWPPTDLRRIAQSVPMPGGPGMLTYMHAPAGLFDPLNAFAALPVGHRFCIAC